MLISPRKLWGAFTPLNCVADHILQRSLLFNFCIQARVDLGALNYLDIALIVCFDCGDLAFEGSRPTIP